MSRARESKQFKLPVRFTHDYTCHDMPRSIFGIKFEERWKTKRRLGNGSYGEVWLQRCTTDSAPGRLRAVKEIPKASSSDPIDYTRELEAIAKFSGKEYARYFIRSWGWYENKYTIFIAMEYMNLGDLQRYLGRAIPEVEAQTITFQLLEALWFMHKDGFAHRDLKPANVFVVSKGPSWWVKVGDFGVSKRIDQGLTALRTVIGTPNYLAPEMLEYQHRPSTDRLSFSYTSAVDIWSVGVITFYMLTGRLPFAGIRGLLEYTMSPDDSPFRVLQDHGVTEPGEDFIRKLLCVAPTDRLSAEEALHHSWRQVIPVPRAVPLGESSPSALLESTEPSGRWSDLDGTETRSDTSLTDQSITWKTVGDAPDNSVDKPIRGVVDIDSSNTITLGPDALEEAMETRHKTLVQYIGKGPEMDGPAQASRPPPTTSDPLPEEAKSGLPDERTPLEMVTASEHEVPSDVIYPAGAAAGLASSSREQDTKSLSSSRHAAAPAPKPRVVLKYGGLDSRWAKALEEAKQQHEIKVRAEEKRARQKTRAIEPKRLNRIKQSEGSSSRERDTKSLSSSRHVAAPAPKPRAVLKYMSGQSEDFKPLLKVNDARAAEELSGTTRPKYRLALRPSPNIHDLQQERQQQRERGDTECCEGDLCAHRMADQNEPVGQQIKTSKRRKKRLDRSYW